MIAAYRADRLSQRPLLRKGLQQSRSTLRQGRTAGGPDSATETTSASETAGSDVSRQSNPDAMGTGRPPREASGLQRPAEMAARGSVFADLVSVAVIDKQSEVLPDARPAVGEIDVVVSHALPAAQPPADAVPQAGPSESAVRQQDEFAVQEISPRNSSAPASAPAPQEVPLAHLGFGPGMLIRLRQLGLHSTDDLARANATELRTALGDISRLVDVERWIVDAQRLSQGTACIAS